LIAEGEIYMEKYEINNETLAVIGINKNSTKILEREREYILNDIMFIDISPNNKREIIKFGKNTFVIIADGNIKSFQYH
jgi:hypothetical protein